MEVVVVLPWVPPTAIACLKRISSASISARRTTGMSFSRAATSSGLSFLIAEDTTSTSASPRLSAEWPTETLMPWERSRCTLAFSAMSDPWTS
jgi:hypothetical protein